MPRERDGRQHNTSVKDVARAGARDNHRGTAYAIREPEGHTTHETEDSDKNQKSRLRRAEHGGRATFLTQRFLTSGGGGGHHHGRHRGDGHRASRLRHRLRRLNGLPWLDRLRRLDGGAPVARRRSGTRRV